MPEWGTYLAYLAAIAVFMITPGPDMMFVIANAGRWGVRAGVAAALGVALGEAVHMTAAALGLASLFAANPVLYQGVRYAGAVYLLYLGVMAWRRSKQPLTADGDGAAGPGLGRAFVRGAVTNLLNPKMILFSIAFLPQFVDASAGGVAGQLLVLGATFVALQIAVDAGLGILAGRLGGRLLRRPRVGRAVNAVTGAVFLGLGVKLIVG